MIRNLTQRIHYSLSKKQHGSTLIICLIILLIMTMLGVTNMRSASMQMKMASNTQSRQNTFHAAEFALSAAEFNIINDGYDPIAAQPECSTNCYNEKCKDGLCFNGAFESGAILPECELATADATPYWLNKNIWNSAAFHQTVSIPNSDFDDAKYIVEFMCHVDKDESAECSILAPLDCAALYRVTSLAVSEDGLSRVMLQSTVAVNLNENKKMIEE